MKSFPNESIMERSKDGSEPVRGGSIGLNRILGRFVERSGKDIKPEFTAVLISAFTVFRNVVGTYPDAKIEQIEEYFVKDINLFLEYYDTYLSNTKSRMMQDKRAVVLVYFPEYTQVPKSLLREVTGKALELNLLYKKFLSRYNGRDELIKKTEHVLCFWASSGHASYPHKDVSRKFRSIVSRPDVMHSSSDTVALISHIPLDYHINGRIRNIHLLESYTGKLRPSSEFGLRLDKEGRIPFNSVTHVVFGDSVLIKPWVTPKVRKALFEQAVKERWISRSQDDILVKISKTAQIPLGDLRKIDLI
jgi:hypothetical protein